MRAASLLRTAVRGLAGHNEAASIPQTLLGLSARGLPACLRQLSSRSTSQLTIGELHSLLDSASIDYRDCFEKAELLRRLEDAHKVLPSHVKARLQYLLQRGGEPTIAEAAAPPLAASALFADEQYVVSLFQATKPSVVHITTSRPGQGMGSLFGGYGPNLPQSQGSGSGFVWDHSGHIVTNYHVIKDASSIKVTLVDNRSYDAELRGAEPDKDLAVLRIKSPSDLTPVLVGSSSGLQVGQRVFAIGFPFALDQSLTSGIVSGLGRQIQGVTGRTIRDVVQTDAAINPGNSGGPLLDSRGRLIGVNTMILSRSGTSSGVGFCIPSDTVRRVVNQIIRHGRVVRPGLGLLCVPDDTAMNVLGPGNRGVIIREVVPGSGAAEAKLRGFSVNAEGSPVMGDIVVSVGPQQVVGVDDLHAAVEQFSLGDTVPLGIRRDGEVVVINVPLLKELDAP